MLRRALVEEREDATHALELSQKAEKEAGRGELSAAQKLAVLREERSKAEESQRIEHQLEPSLPMVIGRSIRDVPGIRGQLAASKDDVREVLMGSKLEILKRRARLPWSARKPLAA